MQDSIFLLQAPAIFRASRKSQTTKKKTTFFKDKSPSLSVIEANIWASKESQKAILIGRNGRKLKELGSAARGKLEEFLDRKVFLSLRVKIDSDWRQSDESLRKYGYKDSDFG